MYETIVILNPNTLNDVVDTKIADWTRLTQDYKASIHRIERWGKKNLAFEVKKFNQGIFLLFHIEGKHEVISELERRFRIADEVIRYQTVKLTELEYKASIELLDSFKSAASDETQRSARDSRSARFAAQDDSDDDKTPRRDYKVDAPEQDDGESEQDLVDDMDEPDNQKDDVVEEDTGV